MPVLPKSLLVLGARLQTARTTQELRKKKTAIPAQQRTLRALTRQFAQTSFGRAVGLESGISYAQFQSRIPLHTYAQLAPYIEQMKRGAANVLWPGKCPFYAVTSGITDGPRKSLPFTWDMLAHFRRADRDSLLYYCARIGNTRQFAQTSFGRAVGLESGISYAQFQSRIPLHTYAQLAPYIEQMKRGAANVLWPGKCPFYAVTSGTTDGPRKSLPVTWDMLAHFRRADRDSLLYYCARIGNTRVFRGRHLLLGGSTALTLIPESAPFTAYEGDLSGLAALNMPPSVVRH